MTGANGSRPPNRAAPAHVGIVIGGSLSGGVVVKLDRGTSVEDVAVGEYVAMIGKQDRSFGMITDVRLETLDSSLQTSPPDLSDPFIADVVDGTALYATVDVLPMLILDPETGGTRPVRTVPTHFAPVTKASADDFDNVFGSEDDTHLAIGEPLAMEDVDIYLDLKAITERSVGVFGKSGTGKTFLVRQLLAGIVRSRVASTLVFDMHSEYGWAGRDQERGRDVKGLKQLFSDRIVVLTLDPESARRRGMTTDGEVRIGLGEIDPEDVEALAEVLNLTDIGRQLPYRLVREYGDKWLSTFLDLNSEQLRDLRDKLNENEGTMQALRRRLEALNRFEFLTNEKGNQAVSSIMDYLGRGFSVVLDFGKYGRQELAYMLVANLLTRRIHENYIRLTETAMRDASMEPTKLIIVIEEAHKFLNKDVASQAVFGTIAREDRKHGVTLLVVDQRPSGIFDEVLSQIGTKLTCLLDNERDVEAVLAGVGERSKLRQVLSRLESRQQALLFGDALPMPVVIHTREYGSNESYAAFSPLEGIGAPTGPVASTGDLFS